MKIGIPLETAIFEKRVSATPDTVKKYISQGHQVLVETDAGLASHYLNDAYEAVGAFIVDREQAFGAEVILKVQPPNLDELKLMQSGTIVIGMLEPFNVEQTQSYATAGITAFALEAAPRTTRAQSLDVLSSQANIAGYKAVMLAANYYEKFMPMLMTAAGTVKAARVVILGAGVAGLQAIATAKRLGAIIEASDVRPAAKEQIESLGAKFIDVPFLTDEEREIAKGEGGYAKPMPADWLQRQASIVAERIKLADIVISTALIPGKTAPCLINKETVEMMKPGAVIVDLAAGKGINGAGNCELTVANEVIIHNGVQLVGLTNLPALVATDASALYARNIQDFMQLIVDEQNQFVLNLEDDIVKACLICHQGQLTKS